MGLTKSKYGIPFNLPYETFLTETLNVVAAKLADHSMKDAEKIEVVRMNIQLEDENDMRDVMYKVSMLIVHEIYWSLPEIQPTRILARKATEKFDESLRIAKDLNNGFFMDSVILFCRIRSPVYFQTAPEILERSDRLYERYVAQGESYFDIFYQNLRDGKLE